MIAWQLSGRLDGATVHASWDDDMGGLVADPALYEACLDLAAAGTRVTATPTGPGWNATVDHPDASWATVRAALDDVTDQFGMPPGYPWGVPEGAVDG